jgi:hypothetical protein
MRGGGARGARPRSGRAGLGCGPGRKPTTHTTTDRNPIANRNPKRSETDVRSTQHKTKEKFFDMMQHPCQLRFLFTRETDASRYTALKLGRRSGTGREKRVTPEFGEYQRRKNYTPKFRVLQTYPP